MKATGAGRAQEAAALVGDEEAARERDAASASRFLNRELSWLDFNERVLALAEEDARPALERAKFLAISSRILDEFFQIRVSGLREQALAGVPGSPDGMSPRDQLDAIRDRVQELLSRQTRIFDRDLRPQLKKGGVQIVDWDDLKKPQREELRKVFDEHVFPVLTPLAVDPAHPFPYISDLSLNLAVVVGNPKTGARHFARVKIPPLLPRFLKVPGGRRFVPIGQVIAAHLDWLFPRMKIVACHLFRVTRDADFEIEVDKAGDLLETLETLLRGRKRSPLQAVRLEVAAPMPQDVRRVLLHELRLKRSDLYVTHGLLDLGDLWSLTELNRPALKTKPWLGVTPPQLVSQLSEPRDIFEVLRKSDVLVHHPYESFATSVEAFVGQAADDPNVLAIKQTIYRTSDEGEAPIVRSLIRAAEAGKETVALVELTARGDEEANIAWARTLEKAGVHVLYGVVGLKTHAKTVLIVRREGETIRRYCHIGTGNYNPPTATIYEDLGLLSSDPELTADVADLFNSLTGYSNAADYRKILVAPGTLRPRLLELIREEADARDGSIAMKMNNLVDPEIIDALYQASAAGTAIDLIVRGICCLRPGVKGMSESIRVRSIVGTFLEHSRIFRFGSDARGASYWIGSADLMPRNLGNRVECVVPVTDPELRGRLEEILLVNLADDVLAWELGPDGWARVPTEVGISAQARFRELAQARVAAPAGR